LLFNSPAAIVAQRDRMEVSMGDRSPKSKQRDQKQKNFAKATGAAQAKSKQDNQSRFPQSGGKGQK
jgi:hypothetical protein